jgi:hypothetical protein
VDGDALRHTFTSAFAAATPNAPIKTSDVLAVNTSDRFLWAQLIGCISDKEAKIRGDKTS